MPLKPKLNDLKKQNDTTVKETAYLKSQSSGNQTNIVQLMARVENTLLVIQIQQSPARQRLCALVDKGYQGIARFAALGYMPESLKKVVSLSVEEQQGHQPN